MAFDDLLIPGAIILVLLAMGGTAGEQGAPEEKLEEWAKAREQAWGGTEDLGWKMPESEELFPPSEMESPFNLSTTMVLEQNRSREQMILTRIRALENQVQEALREGLTRERVADMKRALAEFQHTYTDREGRIFEMQKEDLQERKGALQENLGNNEFALSADPTLDRGGKIEVLTAITEQLAELDRTEALVQSVAEMVIKQVEEFGILTVRNELARRQAPDTFSEAETFSEESLVPNFKSKTHDESTITLETPLQKPWKVRADDVRAHFDTLLPLLPTHASYKPRTPERKVKTRLLHGSSPKRPTPPVLSATFLRSTPNPISQGFATLQTPAPQAQTQSIQQLRGPTSAPVQKLGKTKSRTPTILSEADQSKFRSFDLLVKKISDRVRSAIEQENIGEILAAETQLKRMAPPGYLPGAWYEAVSLKEPLLTKSGGKISQKDLLFDRFYTHFAQLFGTIHKGKNALVETRI